MTAAQQPVRRRGGQRSLADRMAAVKHVQSLSSRMSVDDAFRVAAERAQVLEATMRQWYADYQKDELHDPDAKQANGKRARRKHTEEFRAAAIEALRTRGDMTVDQIAAQFDIVPSMLTRWGQKAGVSRKHGTAIVKVNDASVAKAAGVTAIVKRVPPQKIEPPAPTAPSAREAELLAKIATMKKFMHHLVEEAF